MNNLLVDDVMLNQFVPNDISQKVSQNKEKRMGILSFIGKNRVDFPVLYQIIKTHNVYEVTHLSHVHDLLEAYISIDKTIGKKYSIATTPISVAFNVIDQLPDNVWTNPQNTFLDPGCGSGIFPLVIINKLMDGLRKWEPDTKKRYKHIVENMLFVSDIIPLYIFQYKCLVDPFDQYSLNTHYGSSTDAKFLNYIKNSWNISKFTAIVGMPPYTFRKYTPFIKKLINHTQHMAYVVPTKISISKTESNHFKLLKDNGLHHVSFIGSEIYTPDIEFLYFALDSSNKTSLINVNDVAYIDPIEPLHNYKSKLDHSILVKIMGKWRVELDRGRNEPVSFRDKRDNKFAKTSPTKQYNIKMLARLGGGKKIEYNYIKKNNIRPELIGHKLVFPRSGRGKYKNKNTYINLDKDFVFNTFMDKDIAVSKSIMYIMVKDRLESERMSWYITRSLWVRYIFIQYNYFEELSMTMFSEFIPRIPLNKIMDDDAVFKEFKLTESEIQHIKNVVYDL